MALLKTVGNEILKVRVRGQLTLWHSCPKVVSIQLFCVWFLDTCVSVTTTINVKKYEERAVVLIFFFPVLQLVSPACLSHSLWGYVLYCDVCCSFLC